MVLYRIQLKLLSPIVTVPKGDTIWGHFAWGIANHEGDEAVEKFLEECKTDNPPLIVSSLFPMGTLCKPIPEPKERQATLSIKDYSKIKKLKKEKYISARDYFTDNEGQDFSGKLFNENIVTHNSINRFSNTVNEDGGLFSTKELWVSEENNCFEIYLLSSYDEKRVKELCDWAFENGFGADSSTGKGKIEVCSLETVECSKTGNKYLALSPFVNDDDSIKDLRSDIFVRTGKIGGGFVSCMSPYKKTVVLYDEGAVFECDKKIQFVGKLLTNVHSDSRICQSGFAPVIPIE